MFFLSLFFCSLMFSYSIRIRLENAVSFQFISQYHDSWVVRLSIVFQICLYSDMIYLRRSHDFVSTSFGYYFFLYIFITTHTLWFLFASRGPRSHTYTHARTHLPRWMYSFFHGKPQKCLFRPNKNKNFEL